MSSYFLWGGLFCIVALAKFIPVFDLVGAIIMGVGVVLLVLGK
jgi:hypothetical protein